MARTTRDTAQRMVGLKAAYRRLPHPNGSHWYQYYHESLWAYLNGCVYPSRDWLWPLRSEELPF